MAAPIFITELDLGTHSTTTPTSRKPIRRRHDTTVSRACDQCHRCKLRCTGEKPKCQRCQDNGSACTYSSGGTLGRQRRGNIRACSRRRGVSDPTTTAAKPGTLEPLREGSKTPQAQQLQSPNSPFTPSFNNDTEFPNFHHETISLQQAESESGTIHAINAPASTLQYQMSCSHPPSPQTSSLPPTLNHIKTLNFDLGVRSDATEISIQKSDTLTTVSTPADDPGWTDLSVWEYDIGDTPSAQGAGFGYLHHLTGPAAQAAATEAPANPDILPTPCTECLPDAPPNITTPDASDFRCFCTPKNLCIIELLYSCTLFPSSKPLDQILALACHGITVCEAYLLCPVCQQSSSCLLSCVLIMQLVFQCYSSSVQPSPPSPSPRHGRGGRGLSVSSSGVDSCVKIGNFEIDEKHRLRVVQAIIGAEVERGRVFLGRLEEALGGVGAVEGGVTEAVGGVVRAMRRDLGCVGKG